MRALIIGGTGIISAHVTRQLLKDNWTVYVLNRGNRAIPDGAIHLKADSRDRQSVQALTGVETYDAIVNFNVYKPEDIVRDYELFADRVAQYVFISTASAYQTPPVNYVITESTVLHNPYWAYSRDKIECELKLMELYRTYDFPITIIRPTQTYDKTSLPLNLFGADICWQMAKRLIEEKPVLIHGDGTSLWTFTHSKDLARGIVGLMGNPHAIGECVHITSDEVITWNQAFESLARNLGVKLTCVHVASEMLAVAGNATGYDYEGNMLGDKAYSVVFDNAKIKKLLPGFSATISFDQGIRECIDYHLSNPELQKGDPKFDLFCDQVVNIVQTAVQAMKQMSL